MVAAAAMRCFGSRRAVKFPGRWRLRREIERQVRARTNDRTTDTTGSRPRLARRVPSTGRARPAD